MSLQRLPNKEGGRRKGRVGGTKGGLGSAYVNLYLRHIDMCGSSVVGGGGVHNGETAIVAAGTALRGRRHIMLVHHRAAPAEEATLSTVGGGAGCIGDDLWRCTVLRGTTMCPIGVGGDDDEEVGVVGRLLHNPGNATEDRRQLNHLPQLHA